MYGIFSTAVRPICTRHLSALSSRGCLCRNQERFGTRLHTSALGRVSVTVLGHLTRGSDDQVVSISTLYYLLAVPMRIRRGTPSSE